MCSAYRSLERRGKEVTILTRCVQLRWIQHRAQQAASRGAAVQAEKSDWMVHARRCSLCVIILTQGYQPICLKIKELQKPELEEKWNQIEFQKMDG